MGTALSYGVVIDDLNDRMQFEQRPKGNKREKAV